MSRLIDADKLKEHYSWWEGFDNLKEQKRDFDTIVDIQPTVTAEQAFESDALAAENRALRKDLAQARAIQRALFEYIPDDRLTQILKAAKEATAL